MADGLSDGIDKDARSLERVKGIEPSYAAWEAAVLPLNYTRRFPDFTGWWLVKKSPDGAFSTT